MGVEKLVKDNNNEREDRRKNISDKNNVNNVNNNHNNNNNNNNNSNNNNNNNDGKTNNNNGYNSIRLRLSSDGVRRFSRRRIRAAGRRRTLCEIHEDFQETNGRRHPSELFRDSLDARFNRPSLLGVRGGHLEVSPAASAAPKPWRWQRSFC